MNLLISLFIISQTAPCSPGLEFLRFGVGSRAMGLGNAYTALADEPYGIYYNPAGIDAIQYPCFSTFYGRWFMDTQLGSIASALPVGKNGTVGFGLRGLYTNKIELRSEEDPWSYSYYSAYFLNPSVAYAHRVNNLGIGLGLNGINTKIETAGGNTIFFNTGVIYHTKFADFGATLSNFGPKILHTNLPINVRAGLGIKPGQNFTLLADIIKPLKDGLSYYLGMEFSPLKIFTLRFGYNNDVYANSFITKFAGGMGLKLKNILIDYTAASCGIFGFTHFFTLSYNLEIKPAGPKEEILAKEKMMSETYLNQGIGYYNQGKYEEALNVWDLALIWKPDNQEVLNWIGKVQNDLKKKSVELFLNDGKNEFNQNNFLEAIYNFQKALELDSTLTEAKSLKLKAEQQLAEGISSDIKDKIDQGLAKFKAGDYLKAVKLWNEILKSAPGNTTVQNYIAEANKKMVEKITETLKELNNLITQGKLKRAKELVNRTLKNYPNQENLTKHKLFIDQKITEKLNEYLNNGKKLFDGKNYAEAEKEFQKALEYEPKNSQALLYLDKIRKATTRGKKEDAERYYLLGIDAYTKNNFELAIDYWNKVLAINPSYPNVPKNLERAKIKLAELNK